MFANWVKPEPNGEAFAPSNAGSHLIRLFVALLCAVGFVLMAGSPALAKDRNIPRATEGRSDTIVRDGKQNYPVLLYGVARDWNKACYKGKAGECIRLAEAFEEGLGALAKDNRAAIGYYLLACEKGSAAGCSTSASMLMDGDVGHRNDALAAQNAERGCKTLNDQRSCAILGYAKKRGMGVAPDEAGAFALWNGACASGANLGCQFKAYSLFNEYEDTATGKQAVALFQTACNEARSWGCAGLSFAHKQGRGAAKDIAKSKEFARRGCVDAKGDNHLACIQHGDWLLDGSSPESLAKAGQLLMIGCQGNSAYACARLGRSAVFNRKPRQKTTVKEGFHFLRRGCDLDYAQACYDLGKVYLDGMAEITSHPGITFALWEKACNLRDQLACKELRALGDAELFRETVPTIDPSLPAPQQIARALDEKKHGDKRPAFFTLRDLAREGNEDAEWILGSWIYYGEPGLFDASTTNGLIAIENAASVGQPDAMKWLAFAHWDGNGVPQNRKKAKDYMAYLAIRGDQEAEAIWRNMDAEGLRQAAKKRRAEFLDLMKRLAQIQARQTQIASNYTSSLPSRRPTTSYTGSSSSSLSDSLARIRSNNDYYAANVSRAQGRSCPIGNSYC